MSKTGPVRVNLACGQRKEAGWIGVDVVKTKEVDIVHNLLKYPWPLKTRSVDEVFCAHYVEHIPAEDHREKDRLLWFFDELHRILKPQGKATIIAPYYASMRSWQDPTHRRSISEATFLYTNKEWRKINGLDHYPVSCDFDFSYGYVLNPQWANRHEESRAFGVAHYWNVVADVQVVLVKRDAPAS